MSHNNPNRTRLSRRGFLEAALVAATAPLQVAAGGLAAEKDRLAFVADGNQYRFDTGALRGVLRANGRSVGLLSLEDVSSGASLARSLGICSHYRLLAEGRRYGPAAWDWASSAELLNDNAVRASWSADDVHPFDLTVVYRWTAPDTLDLTTQVTARGELRHFESFLGSYFQGFARAYALVKSVAHTGGQVGFQEALQTDGVWHMFPRDSAAVSIIQDGRWKQPPSPVEWTIRSELAGALAMRRDEATGLAALVMAPPEDCFAVAMPFGEESHRSLYLSLLGKHLTEGQSVTARARLVLRRDLSDRAAIALYEDYRQSSPG